MLTVSALLFLFLCKAQVPPQDECQLVNATEPPQCPETIGPPCPPCVVNDETDYKTGDSLTFTNDEISQIYVRMIENLNYMISTYPPTDSIPLDSPFSVMEGSSGRSFIFMRMYYYTNNITYLTYSNEYLSNAFKWLTDESLTGYSSFFLSISGVWTMAILNGELNGNNETKNEYINKLKDGFNDVINGINSNSKISSKYKFDLTDGTVITGLSSFMWQGMFLNNYYGQEIINGSHIETIAYHIADLGIAEAEEKNVNYLLYESTFTANCYLLGAGEGNGGAVRYLLEASQTYAPGLLKPSDSSNKYYTYIKNTLDFLTSVQLPNDGNIPTWNGFQPACEQAYGNDSDARVQWCHGAPSFIDTFSRAAQIFQSINITSSDNYLEHALIAYNTTWQRGLLIKGLMHCHGIGGNSYQLMHLYMNLKNMNGLKSKYLMNKYSGDTTFLMNESLWRGKQFILWTLDSQNLNVLRTQYSNRNYAMWSGSYGIPMLYIQAIQNGWSTGATPICKIAWDFCPW